MLKRTLIFILTAVLMAAFMPVVALSESKTAVFDFTLPTPVAKNDRTYLGVPDADRFSLGQVDAPIILIEIFSMYCPICQREAKNVNQLFDLITKDAKLGTHIKMIGIGAGNSGFEVDFFRSNYKIAFPMVSDADFVIHKKVGEVGTPHFFGLRVLPDNRTELFFTHSGPITSPKAFFEQFKEAIGRKEAL